MPSSFCTLVAQWKRNLLHMRRCNVQLCSVINSCFNTARLPPSFFSPVSRPFVLTGVTCRHQFPIRQNNIHPILPACDWEISKWSKPTNRIYSARINEETEPSLIALLNNGCLFGNHFPISQPSLRIIRCNFLPFFFPSPFRWGGSLPLWPKESGAELSSQRWRYNDSITTEEAGVVISETSPFLIHAIIVQRNKRSESANVTSESIAQVLQTSQTNGKKWFWPQENKNS